LRISDGIESEMMTANTGRITLRISDGIANEMMTANTLAGLH